MLASSPAMHKSVKVRVTPTAFALIVTLPEYQLTLALATLFTDEG